MTFHGILFPNPARPADEHAVEPDFFADLNLDQVVTAITAGKEDYDLARFFHMPLSDVDDIVFRQEVMGDLEDVRLIDKFRTFAKTMRTVRDHLAWSASRSYKAEKERWFLDAADLYCDAVTCLADDLSCASVASRGLSQFRQYATQYAASEQFRSLAEDAKQGKAEFASIRYALLIYRLRVEVRPLDAAPEFSREIETLFERFRQGDVDPYPFRFRRSDALSPVDAMILDLVSQMHPGAFSRLEAFCAEHHNFLDQTIVKFDREIQFYIAYLEHVDFLRHAGLSFCTPCVSGESREVSSVGGFDLALAKTLVDENRVIVSNDFHLNTTERLIVVTGPNQGGKTTFARAFGQLHYLASLGCPVPGKTAQLPLCDKIFTHFEKQEDLADLRGKLKDDLVRIRAILDRATPSSLVIVNEILSSTSLQDASVLGGKVAARLMQLDLLCVWVTFIDEMASLDEQTVSMVSTVEAENPAERTYRIVRRPADGLAYALSIAEKHRLTREMIEERLKS